MSSSIAVVIGRFQILQRGHGTLLQAALALAPRVLVVIGSAFRARDAHNPFTWEERKQQFEAVLSAADRQRVEYLPVRDYFDDQRVHFTSCEATMAQHALRLMPSEGA